MTMMMHPAAASVFQSCANENTIYYRSDMKYNKIVNISSRFRFFFYLLIFYSNS